MKKSTLLAGKVCLCLFKKRMQTAIQKAYRYCENIVRKNHENFPVASFLIPAEKRPAIWAAYAFAREADQIADEYYPERSEFKNLKAWRGAIQKQSKLRINALDAWQKQLNTCVKKTAIHPIFIAVSDLIEKFNIPISWFLDLLEAFKSDVLKRRHQNWESLIAYSKQSANPVGRLVLKIFGFNDPELFHLSDLLCTGLQLANFWQDIAIDLEKDRIYIPQTMLQTFKIKEEDLFTTLDRSKTHPNTLKLLNALGQKTLPFFEQSKTLAEKVSGRLCYELRWTWLAGKIILEQACFRPERKHFKRPQLSLIDKIFLVGRSFI